MKKRLSVVSMLVVVMLLVSSIATVAFAVCDCGEEYLSYRSQNNGFHYVSCSKCNFSTTERCKDGGNGCTKCGYGKSEEKADDEKEQSSDAEVCEHEYEKKTVEATCTEDGYTKYTCIKCGDSYKKNKTNKLSHWYAEWTPNGDGTQSANCKREGCDHVGTVDCETFEYTLNGTAIVFCPVCGEVENGAHLDLVEDAEATSEALPKGELVLRENGELMSVGYEFSGKLVQLTEPMTVTLPAEIVNGYTLTILAADGTETALEYTVDSDIATFTVNFGEPPVVLIHMVAAA